MGPDAQGWMQGKFGGYQSTKLSAGCCGNGASGLQEPTQVGLVDFCPLWAAAFDLLTFCLHYSLGKRHCKQSLLLQRPPQSGWCSTYGLRWQSLIAGTVHARSPVTPSLISQAFALPQACCKFGARCIPSCHMMG